MPKRIVAYRNSIRYKYTVGLILFAVLLSFCASAIGYFEFRTNFEKQYIERAYTISKIIASQINGDKIESYLKDAVYNPVPITSRSLSSLWDNMDVQYIYLANPDASRVRFIYLRDGIENSRLTADLRLSSSDAQEYFVIRDGRSAIGVNVPVLNSKQKVVGIVRTHVSLNDIQKSISRYLFESLALNLLLAGIITILYVSYVRKKVIHPLEAISQSSLEFASSQYKEPPNILLSDSPDEIGKLTESISKMTHDIKEYIADIENNVIEKEKMAAELRVAKKIQEALLPTSFPKTSAIELYALTDPAKEVGGDFYDFFYNNPHQLSILIGDVSGKGIPAALFMTTTKEILRNRTTDGNSPYRIFEIANEKLIHSSNGRMFVTAWLGKINLESGELTYVSAGHPPAMIKKRNGTFIPMNSNQNKILAAFEGTSYRQTTVLLEKGDVIFLYTDGSLDAEKNGEPFGEEKLIESLNRNYNEQIRIEDFVRSIRKEIGCYEKDHDQKDDVTMLALRYNGHEYSSIDHLM